MPLWISKFKRAWQTQFLSYEVETLGKWVFFKDVQMILVPFFHIPVCYQLRKNALKCSIHTLRRPWSIGKRPKHMAHPVSMILNVSYKVFIFNPLVFSSFTVTIIAIISSPGEMMILLIIAAYKDTLTWIKKTCNFKMYQ